MKRILYVQFTDPAAYPPLERSALLFARAGCDVQFAGIEARGATGLRLRGHPRIDVARVGGPPGGPFGVLKYGAFAARVFAIARNFRPDWIYASDWLSAPAALLLRRVLGIPTVYHEHDVASAGGSAGRAALQARDRLARSSEIVVVPARQRAAFLPSAAAERARVVWNCPLRDEVAAPVRNPQDGLQLVYGGSFSPDRLPISFLTALSQLPATVTLDVYGYVPPGHEAYAARWHRAIAALGLRDRVAMHGTIPDHGELLNRMATHDVGIATIVNAKSDRNLETMAGASNKPFNYMARGLPFLVSDIPEWQQLFANPGYARSCDALQPESIVAAVHSLLDPAVRAEIGARARARIIDDWNYETQFAPVLEAVL